MLLLTLAILSSAPSDSAVIRAVVRDIQVAPGEIVRPTSSGDGEPLVLIPGIFGAAYGYRRITGPLAARGHRTIPIEPLGYGFSSHPKEADYSFAAQSLRISKAIDRLQVKQALFVAQST